MYLKNQNINIIKIIVTNKIIKTIKLSYLYFILLIYILPISVCFNYYLQINFIFTLTMKFF